MKKLLLHFSAFILLFFLLLPSPTYACTIKLPETPNRTIRYQEVIFDWPQEGQILVTVNGQPRNPITIPSPKTKGSFRANGPFTITVTNKQGDSLCSASSGNNNDSAPCENCHIPNENLCYRNGIAGTPTALGCIPNDPNKAIPLILNWAVGLGGGLGFLILLYGAFTLITASGNPENVQKGKSIIGSAISGLLFIVLAVVLLRVIGVDILQL